MKKKSPAKKKPQTRTIDKKPAFLRAFAACASVSAAAEAAGIDRSLHYEWLKNDAQYAAKFAEAHREAAQTLEDAAVEWATVGVFEPLVYQGQFSIGEDGKPLGVYRRSEGLMGRLLKAFLPARYGDRSAVELSGPGGGPIPLEQKKLAKLSDEELAQLIELAKKIEEKEPE